MEQPRGGRGQSRSHSPENMGSFDFWGEMIGFHYIIINEVFWNALTTAVHWVQPHSKTFEELLLKPFTRVYTRKLPCGKGGSSPLLDNFQKVAAFYYG